MFLYLLENTHNQWTESFQYSNASFIEKKLIVPSCLGKILSANIYRTSEPRTATFL
jgi:hypothetical protein